MFRAGNDCELFICATQREKRAAGRPTALKKLLCHDFADGIFHLIFGKIHLDNCRIGNIHRTILICVGSMEIDAFQSFQLRQIPLNRCYVVDVYNAVAAGVAELDIVEQNERNAFAFRVVITIAVIPNAQF